MPSGKMKKQLRGSSETLQRWEPELPITLRRGNQKLFGLGVNRDSHDGESWKLGTSGTKRVVASPPADLLQCPSS